jgi:hypothetical protein
MTIVGKILVILNFLFSLVTGALILMVFVTRTNWHAGYDDLTKKYEASRAQMNALAEEVRVERQQTEGAKRETAATVAAKQQESAHSQQALADRDTQITGLKAQLEATKNNLDAATVDLKRREQEVANLKTVSADQTKKIDELETANKDFRDRAVAAELNFKSEHERNTLLLAQLEKVTQEYERAQAGAAGRQTTAGAPSLRRPSTDMKGSVVESDARSGLVTISLGSDAGVEVGHVLEVYRLKPNPEYVGKIQIVDAQHKQAVGRARMPLVAGPIRVGDEVANRVQ